MSCCVKTFEGDSDEESTSPDSSLQEELLLASRSVGENLRQTALTVPGIHCGGCIRAIETALGRLPAVDSARVNLSTKRVIVRWRGETPPQLIGTLKALGYETHLFDIGAGEKDCASNQLLRAVAVAGFAAMNIMLLSVSVWSGADAATRNLFHWISAAIALPALGYSGRIFFMSAWQALRKRRTNMDVPISIGVGLTFCLSLYDTIHRGEHVYFDASVSLLFFLLIGRTLDHLMREKARSAVKGLEKLIARGARIVRDDGGTTYMPVASIKPGMAILLSAGERVPVDAIVEHGASDLDVSIISGESLPTRVEAGSHVKAGMLNLTGPLRIRVTASAENSFLAEMVRLMEAAEGGRAAYRRIADRVSQLYAPVVHLTALMTFLIWMALGGDWHRAVSIAVSVLIVTCPCAMGLAVPIVQVVAARRLFENGVMIKDGSAMERLAEIDTVVFDKTGTVTTGELSLIHSPYMRPADLHLAAAMSAYSRHPVAKALAGLCPADTSVSSFHRIDEIPGSGIEIVAGAGTYRLGRAEWALSQAVGGPAGGTVLTKDGRLLAHFEFGDRLREGAFEAVRELKQSGLGVELLSGDTPTVVAEVAAQLGFERYRAGVLPSEKADRISRLARNGNKVLMVGDGLNDAPALSAAHVSIAPATAADIGRNTADFVFLRESLSAIPLALRVSKKAGHLIRQNLTLAVAYNAIAVPIAILGYITPLIAALAMSASSLVVVANAFRLSRRPKSLLGKLPRMRENHPTQVGIAPAE